MERYIPALISWRYKGCLGTFKTTDTVYYNEDNNLNYFIWTDGNYSCDCNKSIFFDLTKLFPEDCLKPNDDNYDEEIPSFPCGNKVEIMIGIFPFEESEYENIIMI